MGGTDIEGFQQDSQGNTKILTKKSSLLPPPHNKTTNIEHNISNYLVTKEKFAVQLALYRTVGQLLHLTFLS
jgi:hypothetical protein